MEKTQVSIIPEILNMPFYCDQINAYVPITFFTELGVSQKDIKGLIAVNHWKKRNYFSKTEKVSTNSDTSLIPYKVASRLIAQLADKYPIFKIISTKLFVKSLEEGTIRVEDFAEEFKQDGNFWKSQLEFLDRNYKLQNPVPLHPNIDVSEIDQLRYKSSDWESYLEQNPSYVSYRLVCLIAEKSLDEHKNKQISDYLLKCLFFHERDLEYYYFLYHVAIRDESVCLLVQTLLTEWLQRDPDLVPLHLI